MSATNISKQTNRFLIDFGFFLFNFCYTLSLSFTLKRTVFSEHKLVITVDNDFTESLFSDYDNGRMDEEPNNTCIVCKYLESVFIVFALNCFDCIS